MSKVMTKDDMQAMLSASPYNGFLGLEVVEVDPEKQELVMRQPWRAELERGTGGGQFHGGIIAALIDTAGHYACMMMLGSPLPTINFRTDYLRPAVNTALTARARVWRIGRSISIADVEVLDDAGKTVALGRANYATPKPG